MVSLSANLAHVWQSQIPLVIADRSSGAIFKLYLGPPAAAAVMCAATPRLIALRSSSCGPLVTTRQSGFEQNCPARFASVSLIDDEKSSRRDVIFQTLMYGAANYMTPRRVGLLHLISL